MFIHCELQNAPGLDSERVNVDQVSPSADTRTIKMIRYVSSVRPEVIDHLSFPTTVPFVYTAVEINWTEDVSVSARCMRAHDNWQSH